MERRALCLLSAVIIGLGAIAAADPAAAKRGHALEAEQAYGKLGTAHLPVSSAQEVLGQRLAARGMRIGNPVMIRIFKAEAELEVWMRAGERFELLATYPICNWAGALGPKLSEGDRQSPEGLYSIGRRQLNNSARWRHSLDIGYPNAFDRLHARTGSSILVHGGCTSTGCFAMTDQVMEEIFRLSRAALWNGQKRVAVHIFPFRMTPENMATHGDSHWQGFWANLKEAYDLFERTRLPPGVKVCARRYVVSEVGGDDGCPVSIVATAVKGPRAAPSRRAGDTEAVSPRLPGRNARKAYAEARKARLAARASQLKAAMHRAADTEVLSPAPGRNARKAYAEARKARLAARASQLKADIHRAADTEGLSPPPGRNTRKAYAEARKARLAAGASQLKPAKPRNVHTVVYRKLPR